MRKEREREREHAEEGMRRAEMQRREVLRREEEQRVRRRGKSFESEKEAKKENEAE